MTTLSVVIPVFNEEDAIQNVIRRVLAVRPCLPAAGLDDLELIVVDNCSTDRTAELVAAVPEVRLICHESTAATARRSIRGSVPATCYGLTVRFSRFLPRAIAEMTFSPLGFW